MRCKKNGFVYGILSLFSLICLIMPGVSSPIYQKKNIYIYIPTEVFTTILAKFSRHKWILLFHFYYPCNFVAENSSYLGRYGLPLDEFFPTFRRHLSSKSWETHPTAHPRRLKFSDKILCRKCKLLQGAREKNIKWKQLQAIYIAMAENSDICVETFNIAHWVQLLWPVSVVIAHD